MLASSTKLYSSTSCNLCMPIMYTAERYRSPKKCGSRVEGLKNYQHVPGVPTPPADLPVCAQAVACLHVPTPSADLPVCFRKLLEAPADRCTRLKKAVNESASP